MSESYAGIPVHEMTKISCKMRDNFRRRYFVKNSLAAVLLALPDISVIAGDVVDGGFTLTLDFAFFQHCHANNSFL
jgi:hypothetical protein